MAKIKLWDAIGLGLIIEFPTGIIISNQTGGTACLQPEVEGIYLPLLNDCNNEKILISPETDLINYFEGDKYNGNGATKGIDKEDVESISRILKKYSVNEILQINEERLNESHEAWIHVLIKKENRWNLMQEFEPYPRNGILTWSNSD